MNWFNYWGLIFITIIMIPNIIYSIKQKNNYNNLYKNKAAEIFEQIGRYGCIILMIFNIPYTYFGFYFSQAQLVYIIVDAGLVLAYSLFWVALWNKQTLAKALILSIFPSTIFLFSGILLANIPLLVFAVIFASTHILISVKNVK